MQALSRLDRVAYRAQQFSFLVNATILQETARLLSRTPRATLPDGVQDMLKRRTAALYDRDLENVRTGMYPRDLLFQIPTRAYAKVLPRLALDTPRIVRRKKRGEYKDIPPVDKGRFPAYYRRTFHWQTDGYFSEHSAEVYDLGVELLFRGTADVMRRQVIPPVTRWLRESGLPPQRVRLLDIACGTGRTLRQLATAHPALRYHGVDLSPYYIQAARKLLARRRRVLARGRERRAAAVRRRHVRRRDQRVPVPRAAAQRAPQRDRRGLARAQAGRPAGDRGLGAARREPGAGGGARRLLRRVPRAVLPGLPRGRSGRRW